MKKLLGAAAAACVASGAAVAQPELALFATTDAQVELVQQITEMRAKDGPTAVGSGELLRALAVLYQEAGNDALAIGVLEEARHVTRVHQGLASADEALLLRQQIRSEKALGNDDRVWDLEQDMVTIARRHHDDVRMMPVFRELAEDRTEALEQYRAGRMPPEIYLGCYYVGDTRPYHDKRADVRPGPNPSDGVGCRSGQSSSVVSRLQDEIRTYYADAIETIVKNSDYASHELRELEKEASRIAFFAPSVCRRTSTLDELVAVEIPGSCLEPVLHRAGKPVRANVGGSTSFIRLVSYEFRSAAPAADRANAIAELADWYLVLAHGDKRSLSEADVQALAIYERALRELRRSSDVAESTARIFAPDLPVTLPTFEPNPFASSAQSQSLRYIDVAFAITKNGKGERVEILDSSNAATRAEVRDLIRLIERTSFRPRVVDGKLADAAPVVVRYNLGGS